MMFGAVFGFAAWALDLRGGLGLGAGVAYGLIVLLFSAFVGVPIAASLFGAGEPIRKMPQMAGWLPFTIEHLLYGGARRVGSVAAIGARTGRAHRHRRRDGAPPAYASAIVVDPLANSVRPRARPAGRTGGRDPRHASPYTRIVDLADRGMIFRLGAAVLVLALAVVMLVACHGDMDAFMPVAMACAVVLAAVVPVPRAQLARAGSSAREVRRSHGRSTAVLGDRLARAGPPVPPSTEVLRI